MGIPFPELSYHQTTETKTWRETAAQDWLKFQLQVAAEKLITIIQIHQRAKLHPPGKRFRKVLYHKETLTFLPTLRHILTQTEFIRKKEPLLCFHSAIAACLHRCPITHHFKNRLLHLTCQLGFNKLNLSLSSDKSIYVAISKIPWMGIVLCTTKRCFLTTVMKNLGL